MKKALIGILPLIDEFKDSYWMLPQYMKGIEEAGGIPVMLPLTTDKKLLESLCDRLDGFLFSGGHDISPKLYNEKELDTCGTIIEKRDEMEAALFKLAYERDIAVLGICRGIQLINAVLDGSLYQDLPSQHPTTTEHHQKPPYDNPIHKVTINKESPLYTLLEKDILDVNSYHHQAIKALSPILSPMAYSDDGLIEAIYAKDKKYIWAVQWHPEFSYKNADSKKIFKSFVNACQKAL